jgi:hypothetical protein
MIFFLACVTIPDEAPAVSYDRDACHSCGMLVSEPRFAVQLVTAEGEVLRYDDPACLFRDMVSTTPSVARMWFRDSTSPTEAWIPWTSVAFVPADGSPMNGGLAAVPMGTPGALSFGEASNRVLGGGQ